jgi:hypothetical protein
MDKLFEDAFDPNNKFHIKWLKDFVNGHEGALEHNPFGITVSKNNRVFYTDIVLKLSRKFVNSSVSYKFGTLFSYDYAWHADGEYQNCKLLTAVQGFPKGTRFEYALVYPNSIDFYNDPDEIHPSLTIERW